MKKLFVLLAVLFSSCTTTRYVYVVDDLYYSRPLERRPMVMKPGYNRVPMMSPLPFQYWYWQQQRTQPQPNSGPRRQNLDTYQPRSEFAPPPQPVDKKPQDSEEVKRQAPVRKF